MPWSDLGVSSWNEVKSLASNEKVKGVRPTQGEVIYGVNCCGGETMH